MLIAWNYYKIWNPKVYLKAPGGASTMEQIVTCRKS